MRNKWVLLFVSFFISEVAGLSQNQFFIVRGKVLDSQHKRAVNKADISFTRVNKTLATPLSGEFAVAIPGGQHFVKVIHPDYHVYLNVLQINRDTLITIELTPLVTSYDIDEVTVNARYRKSNESLPGIERIDMQALNKNPSIGGEKDLLKNLSFLPGVQNSGEGSSDLQVRGGTTDQNLYLLDETVVYSASRLFGFISVFHPAIIGKATLYKGAFPARYGGRLSSILETRSRDISLTDSRGEFDLGLVSAKFYYQFPVVEDKSGILLAARRTYFDLFTLALSDGNMSSFNYHDIFMKYSWQVNEKTSVNLHAFTDRDKTFSRQKYKPNRLDKSSIVFQNKVLGLDIKTRIREDMVNQFTVNYTGNSLSIDLRKQNEDTLVQETGIQSIISSLNIKNHLSYQISEIFQFNTGLSFAIHSVNPARYKFNEPGLTLETDLIGSTRAFDYAVYAEIENRLPANLAVTSGARYSVFRVQGTNYQNIEPRFAISYSPWVDQSIKASYSGMTQPLHMIANDGLGMPVNLWYSSTKHIRPQLSKQLSLSYSRELSRDKTHYQLGLEAFYKTTANIPAYLDGYSADYFFRAFGEAAKLDLKDITTTGIGKFYGYECYLARQNNKLQLQAAYTLSWSLNRFELLNENQVFYARNDRRHNLNIIANRSFGKKMEVGVTWTWGSGQPVTLPVDAYYYPGFHPVNMDNPREVTKPLFTQSGRNQFRMKPYHRLDVNARYNFNTRKKKRKATIALDIFNCYNRKNPYYYFLDHVSEPSGDKYVLKSVSLFPIVPSISYSIRF